MLIRSWFYTDLDPNFGISLLKWGSPRELAPKGTSPLGTPCIMEDNDRVYQILIHVQYIENS